MVASGSIFSEPMERITHLEDASQPRRHSKDGPGISLESLRCVLYDEQVSLHVHENVRKTDSDCLRRLLTFLHNCKTYLTASEYATYL